MNEGYEGRNIRWKISCVLPAFFVCPPRDAVVDSPVRHLRAAKRKDRASKMMIICCINDSVIRLNWPMSTVEREVSYLFSCTRAALKRHSTGSDLWAALYQTPFRCGGINGQTFRHMLKRTNICCMKIITKFGIHGIIHSIRHNTRYTSMLNCQAGIKPVHLLV